MSAPVAEIDNPAHLNVNPSQELAVVEYVPMALPEGWDEARLDGHATDRLRTLAARNGLALVEGSVARDSQEEGVALVALTTDIGTTEEWVPVGPIVNGVFLLARDRDPRVRDITTPGARLVRWTAQGRALSIPAIAAITVDATEGEDGVWTATFPPARIVSVRHGLNTQSVKTLAYVGERRVGMLGCISISNDECEIVTSPGTDRVTIVAALEDDEGAADAEA